MTNISDAIPCKIGGVENMLACPPNYECYRLVRGNATGYCDCNEMLGMTGVDCTIPSAATYVLFVFAGVNFLLYMFVAAFAVAAGRALRKRRSLKCNVGTATIFGSGISGLCLAGFVGGIIAARVTDGGWSYFARACMAVGASLGVMALLNLGVLWLDIAEGVRRGTLNSSGLSWKKLLVYATSASFCASTLCLMLFNMFEWVAATGTLVMCPACFIAGCGSVTLTRLIRHDPLAVEIRTTARRLMFCGAALVGGGILYFSFSVGQDQMGPPNTGRSLGKVVGDGIGWFAMACCTISTVAFIIPVQTAFHDCCGCARPRKKQMSGLASDLATSDSQYPDSPGSPSSRPSNRQGLLGDS